MDEDTLDVRGTRVRLHSIDAPEGGQTCQDAAGKPYRCGQSATLALADRIGTQVAACENVGDGEDLNAWLVRKGLALAYREFGTKDVR